MMSQTRHIGLPLDDADELTRQRFERAVFGFWVFLMSDAVIFALLFATYGTMQHATFEAPTAATEFKIGSAFCETLVLLTSSFTFGMSSISMKYRPANRGPGPLLVWMAVTLALGITFVGLELHDFSQMFGDDAYPSRSGFLSAFFALVPLHGLHVLAASVWLIVLVIQVVTLGLDTRVKINILRLGLFWHFLDIVWIGIFSVVYLKGLIR